MQGPVDRRRARPWPRSAVRTWYPRVFRAHLEVPSILASATSPSGAPIPFTTLLSMPCVFLRNGSPYRLYAPGLGAAWRLLRGLIARNPWAALGALKIGEFRQGSTHGFRTIRIDLGLRGLPDGDGDPVCPAAPFPRRGVSVSKFAAFPVALLVGRPSAPPMPFLRSRSSSRFHCS